MSVERVSVEGLREFQRSLKSVDSGLGKAMRLSLNRVADMVVTTAKPKIPLGPARGGHARDSLKAASTQKLARIQAGGKKYPYYPWLDFGGRVGPQRSIQRPFLTEGRYIWKAVAEDQDRIEEALITELTALAQRAGLETT